MMDAETAIIVETYRRRQQLADELLGEMAVQLAPKPKQRRVPAPGWREVGMARFRNTKLIDGIKRNDR